jgi:hypothetical protein
MNKLAIVAIGYNRHIAFSYMLNSLLRIKTDRKDIHLVLTIEGEATEEVRKVAEEFQWPYGEKHVIYQEKRLGLRNHFIWVGDQTEKYENVIFMEDDLSVSPYIINAAEQLIDSYSNDDRIAGGAFYSPLVCEFTSQRFYPINDGGDTYFFQHPYWGNLWQKEKWAAFKEWYKTYSRDEKILPKYVRGWKTTSFKVVYIQYLIETGRYIVFPRDSYVNNMGFAGLHNQSGGNTYQVPIVLGNKLLNCKPFDESFAIYDANFEIEDFALKRANSKLQEYEFDVDLNKTGDVKEHEIVLTFGKSKRPIMKFHCGMKPYELAVATDQEGEGIVLSARSDLIKEDSSRELWFHDFLNNNVVSDRRLAYYINDLVKMLPSRIAKKIKR